MGPAETCRICSASLNGKRFPVAEMSSGSGERFEYSECGSCGCVQLLVVPEDMKRYYPADYYSFNDRPPGRVKTYLKRQRAVAAFGRPTLISRAITMAAGDPPFAEWARHPYVRFGTRILDVGTGSGKLLREMALAGFDRLVGIDPFLAPDPRPVAGVTLLRARLEDMQGPYDTVMLHHVLEHFEDPAVAIREVARITVPGGYVILRVPLTGSYAWRTYGASWIQLDPPRHICIPSVRSIGVLAALGGFEIVEVRYDSTGFQFWGSEQALRGIPLLDPRSVHVRGPGGLFTRSELRSFEKQAQRLNTDHDGDQACFYLRRTRFPTNPKVSPA